MDAMTFIFMMSEIWVGGEGGLGALGGASHQADYLLVCASVCWCVPASLSPPRPDEGLSSGAVNGMAVTRRLGLLVTKG